MKRSYIEKIIAKYAPKNIPFDFGIIKPTTLLKPKLMPLTNELSYGYEALKNFEGIVVIVLFTDVAFDYYIRETMTSNILTHINKDFPNSCMYDEYKIIRKELAVLAGLGKIGRNSLLFSRKFGFNCKIDAFLLLEKIDEYDEIFWDSYYFSKCMECMECVNKCPIGAYDLFQISKVFECDSYITPDTENPKQMCRECITSCEYSNIILDKLNVPKDRWFRYPKRGDKI